MQLPGQFNAHSIFFSNFNTGWVSGDVGFLWSTFNGGLSWYEQQTNTNSFLQSVQFVTDSVGWAVGGAGRIIHTDSMGQVIAITPISSEVPKEFLLEQNFPNPFNSQTIIRFDIVKNDTYRLEIYDLLGRMVDILFNKEFSAGIYQIDFDASYFSTGTYLYKLSSAKNFQVRKFTLIK